MTVYGVWNGQLDDYFYSPNPNNPVAQYGYGYQGVAFAVFPSAVSGVSMSLIVRCITNAGWHYLWPNYCPEGFYEQPVGYLANSGRNPVYYCAKEGSRGHISTPDLRCNGAGGYYAVMILGYETY